MATIVVSASDTRMVFNRDFDGISFYSISQGIIPIDIGAYLREKGNPKYVRLFVSGANLRIDSNYTLDTKIYKYHKDYSDTKNPTLTTIWNTDTQLIVGTGDLRPITADINPEKYPLTGIGIVITSLAPNSIRVYY